MTSRTAFRLTATMGILAVALGAFGAHWLKPVLVEHNTTAIWEKAVFYHFVHTVMLVFMATRAPLARGPWISFFVGIVVFSGSLYVLAASNVRWLGAITPLGGVAFLVGWGWLLIQPPGSRDGREK